MIKELYKSEGVLWRPVIDANGTEFIADTPLCSNSSCHATLEVHSDKYICVSCNREYLCPKGHDATRRDVKRKWEGYKTLGYDIHSLDLPPTKVVDEDNEDENYWVQARISEKEGKRMAVVYFGEKIQGVQNKDDYSQIFIDLDDEQIRFDKTNKNPMKLLCKLIAEFQNTKVINEKRGN